MPISDDVRVLRDLAAQYAEVAGHPCQDHRRRLWTDHNSLRRTRPLVLVTYGMWNVWCRQVFGDDQMLCRDPFYREYERRLRMHLFQDSIGDDYILEPWITVAAAQETGWTNLWGVPLAHHGPGVEGGAWAFDPAIREWSDVARLKAPVHRIDEPETERRAAKLGEAIGDILTINVDRGPACSGFCADICTHLAQLRGLEQLMVDMCESPEELHRLLAFMRDGILANQAAAEQAGDIGMTSQQNQCMTYCHELPPPRANTHGTARKQLWAYCAAQEYTGVGPAMHEEFLLRYQKPIMEAWGLAAYGCCEDLTGKIDMLRQVRNLRIIAVTPRANVARCAQQIGGDYVMSWRPNPTDMVCYGFDEQKIRRAVREGLAACLGCHVHLHLKDVETVEGDTTRLARWTSIVRDIAG